MAICPDGHQSTASDYCDVCGLSIGGTVTTAGPSSAPAGASAGASFGANTGEPCPNCLLPRTDDPFCEGCGYDFATATPVLPATQSSPTYADPAADPALAQTVQAPALDLDAELEAAIAAANQKPADPTTSAPSSQGASQPSSNSATSAGTMPASAAAPTVRTAVEWTIVATADRAYYDSVVAEGEIDPNAYPFPPYCPERRFNLIGDTVRIGRSSTVRGTVVEVDLTGPPTDAGVSHLHAVLQARPDGGWTLLDPGAANGTVLNDDTAPIPVNQPVPIDDGYRIHVGIWTTLTLMKM